MIEMKDEWSIYHRLQRLLLVDAKLHKDSWRAGWHF